MSVVYNCPSCGVPVALKYRFSKMAVCDSCKQTSMVEGEALINANMKRELADFIDGIIYGTGQLFSFEFLSNETLFFLGNMVNWHEIDVELPENPYQQAF